MVKNTPLPKGTIIPDHIAVVLDGNGRWARSRNLPVTKGHEYGAKALKSVMDAARNWGVHTLTIWGWSTENWKRPPAEKRKIFSLIKHTLLNELKTAKREGIRFHHIGRRDRLPNDLLECIKKVENETSKNTKYILNVALDYGGRDEILRAVKKIVTDEIPVEKIDEELFSTYLDTADQPYPYPDLFIRTSGEQRTSGFLPWQSVYAEFYFEPDHLPDMTPEKLKTAILDYSRRRRRFGAKDKVKHFKFKPAVTANLEVNWWRLRKIPYGTRFRDYVIAHLQEQYGLSKKLAVKAASMMIEAVLNGDKSKWQKSLQNLKKFYRLIKDELKMAFEPSLAASLELKLWQGGDKADDIQSAGEIEDLAKNYYSEVYRISKFQATKIAHLRMLATIERNRAEAEAGGGDLHWVKAYEYLNKYYSALKDRIA
ncbi:MAG TPA: polyprenyl diphosphate synthase [Patescibacteria group bacterium]|nr:polyprenyl diphosphate synthase [Patescibacteria group bacterium]